MPFVFTEQGVAMLSSVLKSDQAIQVNIQIMKTFTNLRKTLAIHEDLMRKIESMETAYNENFSIVFEAINQLLNQEDLPDKKIGFTVKEEQSSYGNANIYYKT